MLDSGVVENDYALKYSGVTSGESKIVKIVVVEFWLTTICHHI